MTQIPSSETHEGKQRNLLALLVYFLIAIGIATYIAFKDCFPITFFQDLLLDSDNMYPVKAVFMLNFAAIALVLFPLYWVAKKMIGKKNQAEALSMPLDTNSNKKEFSFTYSAAVCSVIMDGMYVQIKMGFVKRVFLASKLRNYYLVSKSTYQTLYISYEDETGKVKKCPMNSNAGDAEMASLMEELKARFPDKSLNHLSQAEAFKTMKVMNPALLAVIVLIAILGITALVIYFAVR